ncbi:MAG TPA: sigma-70 family RNA polymerase sigma factor [Gaiellaceae bacterium]|nr:sigma-70 family RNA polymerase sigma factor [Gaiellaceae bacterium]
MRSLARRYRDMGLPLEDLVQEGAIGLLEAIDHFDAANGASFSTYAYWRARRTMTHALTDHGRVLHLPKSVLERRRAIADATADLLNAGRRPTAAALAEVTHLTVGDVVAAMEAPTTIASLDAPLDDGTTLEGTVADPAATEPSAAALAGLERAALAGAVRHLSPRQRAVVDARYGLSGEAQTLTEIGARLHVSPARVRAIESDALHDLAMELEPPLADP